jgi:Domain of unknown function (DUF1707)
MEQPFMGTTGNGDLRVSDADRDRALAELSEHFQAGRLDADEFEERSGRALRARTRRELAELFTDLPRDRAQAPAPADPGATGEGVEPARLPSRGPGVLVGVLAVALVAFVADMLANRHGFGGFHYGGPGVGVVVVLLVVRALARRHHGRW